ncbi:hypothetical protein HID58_082493 [Brassica napus]|uniref:Zinc knuckle CX2CX4HX4C domain-containing protein n=1 Tax=Brassica napus TaxID=3708 RepID=A0ABQ7YAR2_BRANA|nr:hypothetical protein HID58_082493 [Brassica napus]
MYRGALGEVDKVDVENGRVRVQINADEPLQFERKAGYANGDVIKVSLSYEELHRYCYTCKRISHEEGTCPELAPEQREANRIARLEKKEKEELAAREAFSAPVRGLDTRARFDAQMRKSQSPEWVRKIAEPPLRRNDRRRTEQGRVTEHGDLRARISSRRDNIENNVWNRLDHNSSGKIPRDRERYHPYNRDIREDARSSKRSSENNVHRSRYGDSASSSSWRVKGSSPKNQNRHQSQSNVGRRFELSSRSNRNSPDSQRTVSEYHRYNMSDHVERRYEHQPRNAPRLEWQPVRAAERRTDIQARPVVGQENERDAVPETEEERRRRIKGKSIVGTTCEKEDNQGPMRVASGVLKISEPIPMQIPENQVYVEKGGAKSNIEKANEVLQKSSINVDLSSPGIRDKREQEIAKGKTGHGDKETTEDDQQLMSEEEINQMMDQYASVNLYMDEEMLEDDDLLDESMEEDVVIPETQEVAKQTQQEKRGEDQALGGVGKEKEKIERAGTKASEELDRSKRGPPEKQQHTITNKRRGMRSPDPKGIAASRKLASRGRLGSMHSKLYT